MQNIITKYLSKNILVVFFALFFVIIFLILGNTFTLVLKSSLNQNLDILSVISLVVIKSLKETPIIITLAFFLAITIAINKMYKESEIYAMQSAGIGELKILKKIGPLILLITTLVFYISAFLVPQSHTIRDKIIQNNSNSNTFKFIKTGEFQKFQNGKIVLYATTNKIGNLSNIFIYQDDNIQTKIILAQQGERYQDGAGDVYIKLKNGAEYSGFFSKEDKQIIKFANMDIQIFEQENNNIDIRLNNSSIPLSTLLVDLTNQNIAELWWRISLPLAVIILSSIAIFLAKSPPRNTKNLGVLYAIIIFAIYLNLLKSCKDNITDGESLLINMLLPHVIFIILAFLLYIKNNGFTK